MKTSTRLKQAKKFMEMNNLKAGICYALDRTYNRWSDEDNEHIDDIQNELSNRLGRWCWAHQWLADQMTKHQKNKPNRINDWLANTPVRDIQQWRLQWMDNLIAEYQAKGD